MKLAPTLTLNDGHKIPQLGLGMWQVTNAQAVPVIQTALDAGYRSIDTAMAYKNEEGTGEALRKAGIAREQVYITTKLWNCDHGAEKAAKAMDASLKLLGLPYVDLYLIHWPQPMFDRYVETWKALIRMREEGKVKSIGVSNFNSDHLQRIIDETGVTPAVNQIELHPQFQQAELRAYHAKHGIITESWSPLAQGGLVQNADVLRIAQKHGRTAAQIILRWHVELGLVVIPKSITPSRIVENISIFDFHLDADDMAQMTKLDCGNRTGPDPKTFSMQ